MSLICCYYLDFENQDQQDQFELMLGKQGIAHYDATLGEINLINKHKTLEAIEILYEGK